MQDLWLWILLVGPLLAPIFMTTGQPILRFIADGIYLLGETVCPKVNFHVMVFDYPLAVCSSCWAAVFGLWTVRLLYGRAGEGSGPFARLRLSGFWARWQSVPVQARLVLLLLGFAPWALDVMLTDLGSWYSPQSFMALVGYTGGISAAMLLFPARATMRARLASKNVG